jgi:hypothetical protein
MAQANFRTGEPVTEPGPDGHLWQLWEYADEIVLQRDCDAEGCEKGLLHTPARFCTRCQGGGLLTKRFPRPKSDED